MNIAADISKIKRSFLALMTSLVIGILIALSSPVYADSPGYTFLQIETEDGLTANQVKSILRDRYGFVWIGTNNGLNRYDGFSIKTYDCNDTQTGKRNNNIDALYEDKDGTIWVGTDRGVYRYDPHTEQFRYVAEWDTLQDGYVNWVQNIVGDSQGNVWALVPDNGIYRHSRSGDRRYWLPKGKSYERCSFNDICIDSHDNLWVVGDKGKIYRYDKGYDEIVEVGFSINEINAETRLLRVIKGPAGTLIVGSDDGRIWQLFPESGFSSRLLPFYPDGDKSICSLTLLDSYLWIGTRSGLYSLSLSNGTQRKFENRNGNNRSISDNTINVTYADRDGMLWIGTLLGGINLTKGENAMFTTLSIPFESRRIKGLAFSPTVNRLAIGSESTGILLYNLINSQSIKAPTPLNAPNATIYIGTSDGTLLAAPQYYGLWAMDTPVTTSKFLPEELTSDNSVYSYLKDSQGNEWFGTGHGLFRRSSSTREYKRIEHLSSHWIFSLLEASDGSIWIGTMGNGLFCFNPKANNFNDYIYDENSSMNNGLQTNSINSLMEDRKENIWVSTDRGGLSKVNLRSGEITTYGVKEGLPDDVVYPVVEDAKGHLWFGTNRGLVELNPASGGVRVYTIADGLPDNQFTYNSAICGPDSVFYFGTTNGVVSFHPSAMISKADNLAVMFTSLTVGGENIAIGKDCLLEDNIIFTNELSIPHDKNTFTLTVGVPAAISIDGEKQFYYRLLPGDKKWNPMEGNRISFVNLSTGKHILEVKMVCGDIEVSGSMRIVVRSPYYLSIWANIVYMLITLSAVGIGFHLYRRRQLKRLHERQEAFASNQEKELYQRKLNFFTEIAHEIRTPLSLIDLPLEAIQENGLTHPESARYLEVTRQNTARLLELTSQLLDFQKIEAGKLRLKPVALDMKELVIHTLDRFEPTIKLKNKTVSWHISEKSMMTVSDKEAVTKIISNLLNNALKYSESSIEVNAEADDEYVRIKIGSDGEKITGGNREKIFETFYQTDKSQEQKNGVGIGLPLSRSLAQLLGGELYLENNTGEGNVFVLSLPVKKVEIATSSSIADEEKTSYILEEESNQTPLQANGYHVLLVEDNDGIRSMLNERLSNSFLISVADNGRKALEILKSQSIDIVVTDIMMPQMDGMELCRQIKADPDLSHIPIVFITAKNDLDSKVKGLQIGAEAYIEKPFSIKYLREMVTTLLENRRRAREAFAKNPFFQAENIPVNREDEKFMEKVILVIKENISDESFNVETLGDKMFMSRSNLLRHIKAVFNLSPSELIRVVRLKHSAELIKTGRFTLGEISHMVGISSQSYFTKLFFKQFNVMPNEFAKQNTKKSVME